MGGQYSKASTEQLKQAYQAGKDSSHSSHRVRSVGGIRPPQGYPTQGFPPPAGLPAPIARGSIPASEGEASRQFYDNVEDQRIAKTAMAIFNGKQWQDTEGVLKRSTLNPKTVGTYWYSQPDGVGLGTGIDTIAGRGGWWPWFSDNEGSYAGGVRVEPANWPKDIQPPYVNAWRSGSQACGPSNPCPWGGPNNEGTTVKDYSGKWVRRGMCIRGKCDCPIGQDGDRLCSGAASIGATGDVLWSPSEYYPPTSNLWEMTVGY